MNYRHIYHAGNICDVIKHIVASMLLDYLRQKDSAFFVLDTHAGIGLYDLLDERAQKTDEAKSGILKLLASKPQGMTELEPYRKALAHSNPLWNPLKGIESFRFYPGSPRIVESMLCPQDRLVLCELHDEDIIDLRRSMARSSQTAVHHRDGFEALKAFLPPPEKRGLVIIDPPYETLDEFQKLATAIADAHKRWPQGMFLIWYPVKDRPALWNFHDALMDTGIPKQLIAEFIYQAEDRTDRLNGSGMILINPPWRMDERLRDLLPRLHKMLETAYQGTDIRWLVGEVET
jgi:23S rRNA (adenine2030-N6)-methyltransferase